MRKKASSKDVRNDRITPAMLRAGVDAFKKWDRREEEPEVLVASIWYALRKAEQSPTLPE